MQLVGSDAMKRSVGTQSNDVTRYIDGMLPAYANDADTAFTAGCSDRADRIVWRSNGRHIHTRTERPITSNHRDRTSFLITLFICSRGCGRRSIDEAISDELLHDGENVIGQPIQHETSRKIDKQERHDRR